MVLVRLIIPLSDPGDTQRKKNFCAAYGCKKIRILFGAFAFLQQQIWGHYGSAGYACTGALRFGKFLARVALSHLTVMCSCLCQIHLWFYHIAKPRSNCSDLHLMVAVFPSSVHVCHFLSEQEWNERNFALPERLPRPSLRSLNIMGRNVHV